MLSSLDMINKEILEKYLVSDRLPDNFLQLQVLQQEFLQISQSAQVNYNYSLFKYAKQYDVLVLLHNSKIF